MPTQVRSDGAIQERVALLEAVRAQAREVERIKVRLYREKQFNKRVAINAELRAAKRQLAELQQNTLTDADDRLSTASE